MISIFQLREDGASAMTGRAHCQRQVAFYLVQPVLTDLN